MTYEAQIQAVAYSAAIEGITSAAANSDHYLGGISDAYARELMDAIAERDAATDDELAAHDLLHSLVSFGRAF